MRNRVRTSARALIGASPLLVLTLAILAVCAVCVFAGAEVALANTPGAIDRVADSSTSDAYKSIFGMVDEDGNPVETTRYAGRVWTDKSVTASDSVSFTGSGDSGGEQNTFTFEKKEQGDFLVTYSAMATSQQITKLPKIPVDVVFVLDFSASMTWGVDSTVVSNPNGSDSRIKAMIDAMNETIAALKENNPDNRIAIVTFNRVGHTMLPLTPLDDVDVQGDQYLTMRFWTEDGVGGKDNGHAEVTCHINGQTLSTDSKTNIQSGLFEGMSILAEASDTVFTATAELGGGSYTRIPNVVLMSDGAPTTISLATDSELDQGSGRDSYTAMNSWWESLDDNGPDSVGWGDNFEAQSANGFMAMLTAEYLKDRIAQNYQRNAANVNAQNINELTTSMYTIGFGINEQNKSMVAMANLVLNPVGNWDEGRIQSWATGNEKPTDGANDERGLGRVVDIIDQWQALSTHRQATVGYVKVDDDRSNPINLRVGLPQGWDIKGTPSYVDEYFPAESADQLKEAFQQITDAITDTPKVPTEVAGGNPLRGGYITYTDPIGEYMEVKAVSGLLFGNKQFYVNGTDPIEGGVRYNLAANDESTSVDSGIYSNQNVNNIVITVTRETTGRQTLTVKIPAALIPLRINEVDVLHDDTVNRNESNNVYPLRLVYEVGVTKGVVDEDGNLIEGEGTWDSASQSFNGVSPSYIEEHQVGGSTAFYSNYYSGAEDGKGDATVEFTPADDNPFYFVQENTPLYTDQGCSDPATGQLDPSRTYYFKIAYYGAAGTKMQTATVSRNGSDFGQDAVGAGSDGQLYIKEGMPRLGNLLDAVSTVGKGYQNNTSTASHPYYPTFVDSQGGSGDANDGHFVVYLGSNGRRLLSSEPEVRPALRVTKVDADDDKKLLPGAEFTIYEDDDPNDGNYKAEVDITVFGRLTTGKEGEVLFTPVSGHDSVSGHEFALDTNYYLVETKAPDHYQLMSGAVTLRISENTDEDGSTEPPAAESPYKMLVTFQDGTTSETVYSSEAVEASGQDYQVATLAISIADEKTPNLPATGSTGRSVLAATGAAAVALGAYALWTRRKALNR